MSLTDRDIEKVWHPYTQFRLERAPIALKKAANTLLIDENGNEYIDTMSSWWVNLHGHSNPFIAAAIAEAAKNFDQVMFAGFTHEPAVKLAEELLNFIPGGDGFVFFSDDGSTAVEAALKMALQFWYNSGQERKTIVALEDSYHGDTFGAMSVSGNEVFHKPFREHLFEVKFIPRPTSADDQSAVRALSEILDETEVAAFIFEPLVQGAAGMKMYPAAILEELLQLCKRHRVITIADEVFTGFGRTGKMLATDHVTTPACIYVFSKGLSGGYLPIGATVAPDYIFEAFLGETREKMFLHGHSYTANPLCCAAANASLELLRREETVQAIKRIEARHSKFVGELRNDSRVIDPRSLGTIMALEVVSGRSGYHAPVRDKLYNFYLENGLLLRPLGNTVYIVPPYCITDNELDKVYDVIFKSLDLVS